MKGARYLLRRLLLYAIAGWVALTLNFLIPRAMPGDPTAVMFARFEGQLDPQAIEALKAAFGLTDGPLWQQYLTYLGSVARGDLGISIAWFPTPVGEVIVTALTWTVVLAGTSLVIAFVLGSALGALAAWRRGGWVDRVAPLAFSLIGAFPYFWLAMLAAWWLGLQKGWFPLRHAYGPHVTPGFNLAFLGSAVQHAFLPALTLVIASLGGWLLTMRNAMIGALGRQHIQYALARGLRPGRVWFHYGVRNALLPSLTSFGMALGFVLSGALLTEIIFSYPGQGYLLLQAVRSQDFPLLQGLFLTITGAVLAANFAVDLLTLALDPRARRSA